MNSITNGNSFPDFNPNLLPFFEPNQVLKNSDLNSTVTYLDSHNRLTRTHLIGMGIVCGLEVKLTFDKRTAIEVTAGCGITSEGFIVQYLPDVSQDDLYQFTHYQKHQKQLTSLLISTNIQNKDYEFKELILADVARQAKDKKNISLTGFDFRENPQVVLILYDWDKMGQDACLIDCNRGGSHFNFQLRFFLIDRSTADELLKAGFSANNSPSEFQSCFELTDCYIDRVGCTKQNNLANIQNWDDLVKAYYRVCKSGILSLGKALKQTHKLFSPFISTFQPPSRDLEDIQGRLKEILIALVPAEIANKDPFFGDTLTQPQVRYGIQYFYDYLVELITAFNELKTVLFDLMDECPPNMQRFPTYLLAGTVVSETEPCSKPDIYRHPFYQPPIYNGNQQRKKEVRHLYDRLVRMSTKFQLLPFYQTPVKITPSRTRQALLGEQAIPYYYSYSDIYSYWSYDACRKQRSPKLPAYFRLNGLSNQRGDDLTPRIDWADFFRIEGHIGRPLDRAWKDIESFRDDFNLAFDVVPVRLGDGGDDPSILKGYFDDLEIEFEQLKIKWKRTYQIKQDEHKNRPSTARIIKDFNILFFSKESLIEINLASIENDFLKYACDQKNYKFESSTGKNRIVLQFPSKNTEDARIALVTKISKTGTQIERTIDFNQFSEATRDKNQQLVIETFTTCLSINSSTLSVEIDPAEPSIFRFVLSDGEETIKLVEETKSSELTLLLRLEDETRYESSKELIDRYQNIESLYALLQFFGQRENLDREFDFAGLVFYHELRSLFRRYFLRLEIIKRLQQLKEYAKEHPGLEHLGGVHKGGTFVLIYTDDSEVIKDLITTDTKLLPSSLQLVSDIEKDAQFPSQQKLLFERLDQIRDERIGQKVVIADFCLPYYCCGNNSINYVIDTPCPCIYLPKSVFCENDTETYNFELCPPGGFLKGGGGIINCDGGYAFSPSKVKGDITKPTNLTFFYILDGVSSSFTVLLLPVTKVCLKIENRKETYYVSTGKAVPIRFNITPSGGQFQISINETPYSEIQVDQNNTFNLATIPFPEEESCLSVQFIYTVCGTDDYCGNTSEPLKITLKRHPQPYTSYDFDEGIGGDLIESWEDK